MAGRRITNPGGSSNALRGDVLRVLGVLKVATVDQIQRITAPHLTYRHTTKPTPAVRKTARTAAHAGALADLRRHGLVMDAGRTRAGEVLRSLTPQGLEAASHELRRPMAEMGGTARGAGRSGAPHAMAVNETVIALLRPKPDMELLAVEPDEAQAAAQAVVDGPDGVGTVASYATEVPLPVSGTWTTPGRGGVQADIVLTAPESGLPLLFIEVDNGFEDAARIAAKFERYQRFFERGTKNQDGTHAAMWRQRWSAPPDPLFDRPHPPVLLVFNPLGPRPLNATASRVMDLTRGLWQGEQRSEGGRHHTYDERIPLVAAGMGRLREHGPARPAFWRFGRDHPQSLVDAVGNPRRAAALTRARTEHKARLAAREAQRPVCAECGEKFSDWWWNYLEDLGDLETRHLCQSCDRHPWQEEAQREVEEAKAEPAQVEEPGREGQRPLEEERKGGWLSRLRS